MEQNKTVSPDQGSEPKLSDLQPVTVDQVIKMLERDIKTVRALCCIIGSDPVVEDAVKKHLQKNMNVTGDLNIKMDALIGASMLRTLLESELIKNYAADVLCELQNNVINARKIAQVTKDVPNA